MTPLTFLVSFTPGITMNSLQALQETRLQMPFMNCLGELLVPPFFIKWRSRTSRDDKHKIYLVLA
jgi:hypothetical protein